MLALRRARCFRCGPLHSLRGSSSKVHLRNACHPLFFAHAELHISLPFDSASPRPVTPSHAASLGNGAIEERGRRVSRKTSNVGQELSSPSQTGSPLMGTTDPLEDKSTATMRRRGRPKKAAAPASSSLEGDKLSAGQKTILCAARTASFPVLDLRSPLRQRKCAADGPTHAHPSKGSVASTSSDGVIPESTVARGTRFELDTLMYLSSLGMNLDRVGGRNDQGTDLLGWWNIQWPRRNEPHSAALQGLKMRVIVQCKAEKRPLGPRFLREFEGTLHRAAWSWATAKSSDASSGWWSPEASGGRSWPGLPNAQSRDAASASTSREIQIGVLASSGGFSKRTIQNALNAPMPLLLLHLGYRGDECSRSDSALLSVAAFLPNYHLRTILSPAVSSIAPLHYYPHSALGDKEAVAPCILWRPDVQLPDKTKAESKL